MKRILVSLVVLCLVLALAGCDEEAPAMNIGPASLTQAEEAIAKLLGADTGCPIFDFQVDDTVQKLSVNAYELVDGQWEYVCDTDPPGMTAPSDVYPGYDYEIRIDNTTLCVRRLYGYNEKTDTYYYDYPEDREVILPAGRYRVTKCIDRPELCLLTCEFEITE